MDSRPGDWDHMAAPHQVGLEFNNITEAHMFVFMYYFIHSITLKLGTHNAHSAVAMIRKCAGPEMSAFYLFIFFS